MAHMSSDSPTAPAAPDLGPQTHRVFFLGAGFSRPAGLPLASELVPLVQDVAKRFFRSEGYSHLENAIEQYAHYLADIDPDRAFDFEEFGAWLDWEHTLRLKGSDTFSDQANEAGLQLRWAIGKVLYEAMPPEVPELYLEFARRLNVSDRVRTINYDILLERALEAVGVPYRRFPGRYSEVYETHSVGDPNEPRELVLSKLHGSMDWVIFTGREDGEHLGLQHLVDGPRQPDDPLLRIGVIAPDRLSTYYSAGRSWWASPPLLLPPSTAKPLARSELVPLWDGVGLYSYMLGGFTVIGASLPPGDPYVAQLIHHIATDYASGRPEHGTHWPQRRMKVVDLCRDDAARERVHRRFRFFDRDQTDLILDGFDEDSLDAIFADDPPT